MKYTEAQVTFAEVPDEISLVVNISNCPNRCPGCHSPYLWEDTGKELTIDVLDDLISKNKGISCVVFAGGDIDPPTINKLAEYVKSIGIKTCWYSGNKKLSDQIEKSNFDFIKIGPYIEALGPLNDRHTNQRFYKVEKNKLVDITNKFWKKVNND